MASRPIQNEWASAPSNVVRLPTAAPRKVDNRRFAEQRQAARAARKGSPFEGRFIHGGIRPYLETANDYYDCAPSPELALALAIFKTLPLADQSAIMAGLACQADRGSPAHRKARSVIRVERTLANDERLGVDRNALIGALLQVSNERGL